MKTKPLGLQFKEVYRDNYLPIIQVEAIRNIVRDMDRVTTQMLAFHNVYPEFVGVLNPLDRPHFRNFGDVNNVTSP